MSGEKSEKDKRAAAIIIASELARVINWHKHILKLKHEDNTLFETWGLFLPSNSLGQHRTVVKLLLYKDEFKDLEDAYIRFSTFDRQMQSIIQTWSSCGHTIPSVPAQRWSEVFWRSIQHDDTKEQVGRLKILLDKLDKIAMGK